MKATLYRIFGRAFSGSHVFASWSLRPYAGDAIAGSDDGGSEWDLPEGFEVAESEGGTPEIYGPDGHYSLAGGERTPRLCGGKDVQYVDFQESTR